MAENITLIEGKPDIVDNYMTPLSIKHSIFEEKFKLANQSILRNQNCIGFSEYKCQTRVSSNNSNTKKRSTSNFGKSYMLNLDEESIPQKFAREILFETQEESHSDSEYTSSYSYGIREFNRDFEGDERNMKKKSIKSKSREVVIEDKGVYLMNARGSRFEKKVIERLNSGINRSVLSSVRREMVPDEEVEDEDEGYRCRLCNLI